jgi:hypothetical protein
MKKEIIHVLIVIGLFVIISAGTSCHSGKKGEFGIKMTIELPAKDILQSLSGYSKDTIFERSILLADETKKTGREDYITLFEKAWDQVNPGGQTDLGIWL